MKKQYEERSYQIECWQALAQARRDGLSKGLIVVASSLGKTFISIRDVEQFWSEYGYGRVLFMCHSNPILDQTKEVFQEYYGKQCSYGFYTGLAKSSIPTTFLFATFQSLAGHLEEFEKDEFDYIIVDEAHHAAADTYRPVVEYFQPKFLLGMTATPDRLDRRNIEEIFGSPIFELPMAKALIDGWITEIEYNIILDEMEEIGFYLDGDQKIAKEELNRKVFMPKRDEEIIRLIKQYANEWCENPQTIIYCKNITHAQKIAELYEGAEAITSESESKKNREIIARFKSGELRTIVSVEMLNEGVDVPSVDVIVFLRNTSAPRIFWQQLNRGTRKTTTKTEVLALDFVANVERMEMIFETQKEIEDILKNQQPEGRNEGETISASDVFSIDIPTPQFKGRVHDIEYLLMRVLDGHGWSREGAIIALQDLATRLGKNSLMPKDIRFADKRTPSRRTLAALFGSVKLAILAAGLEVEVGYTATERGSFDSEEELFAAARAYAVELGHSDYLTLKDIDDNYEFPCWETLRKTYFYIDNFLHLAGFPKKERRNNKSFTKKEEIVAAFKRKRAELGGKIPTKRQIIADGRMPSICQITKVYETFNNALLEIFGEVNMRKKSLDEYPDEAMKEEAQKMYQLYGRAPTMKEWNENPNTCSASVLEKRHKTYNNAMLKYGIEPNQKNTSANPHPRKLQGIFNNDETELTEEVKDRLRNIVRQERRRIKGPDLNKATDLPKASYFFNHGWTLTKINDYIGTEKILAAINEILTN